MSGRLALLTLLDRWDLRNQEIPIHEIVEELSRLDLTAEDLANAVSFDERSYRRHSIRRGATYEALILSWRSGQRSPIHDHRGSCCGVLVVEGRATETLYARTPCGRLVPKRSRRLKPGQVVGGSDRDTHQMANLERAGRDLITLHIYSPPPSLWRYYALDETTLGGNDELIPGRRASVVAPPISTKREDWFTNQVGRMNMSLENSREDQPAIAIIGSGFSGTMVAHHLIDGACSSKVKVRIFEKSRRFARGLAYSTDCDSHLLNVPAGMMSGLPDQPSHFLDWLKSKDSTAHSGTFASRRLYGDYLQSILRDAVAASDGRLELIQDEVIDIEPRLDPAAPFRLATTNGREFEAHQLVLALGHPPVQDPTNGIAARIRGYVANPWASGLFDDVKPDDDLLLIGTGLTAVDVILEAENRGHRGTIHAISRHGYRPCGHRPAPPRPHFELTECGHTARSLLSSVRREAQVCEGEGGDWRSVVDSLRPVLPTLWRSMETSERARFIRHLAPRWDVHRHRVAPAVEQALATAECEGRVVILAGRIERMTNNGDHVLVRYRLRGGAGAGVQRVRKVINCTGPGRDIRRSPSPLLASLFDRGMARPGPLALGLDVADDGRLLDVFGSPQDRLVALGPILKDAFWETTAVRELRVQAEAVASSLNALWVS